MSRGRHNETDSESLSEEMSPSDGYFTRRSHPQEMLVPAIALEESRPKRRGTSEHQHEPRSSFTHTPRSETSPLLESTPPPPAYSLAAPSSSQQRPIQPAQSRIANDHSGGVNGSAALSSDPANPLPRGYPISVGHPASLVAPNPPPPYFSKREWAKRSKRCCRGWSFKKGVEVLFVAVLIGFGIAFFSHGFSILGSRRPQRKRGQEPDRDLLPSGPFCPSATEPLSPEGRRFELSPQLAPQRDFRLYVFYSTKDLHILDGIDIQGEIRVQSTDEAIGRSETIVVDFDVRSSHSYLNDLVSFASGDDMLVVRAGHSRRRDGYTRSQHCMSILATITIPRKMRLRQFEVAGRTLKTRFLENLDFDVDGLMVTSDNGDLDSSAKSVTSRKTRIDLGSGSITGQYQLLDLLSLKTTSGSVHVSISPQPAEEGGESVPARFDVKTVSGSVQASFPSSLSDIPHRLYHTDVSSVSGAISGYYLLGASNRFRTTSGSINLSLLPGAFESSSSLSTHNMDGNTDIAILSGEAEAELGLLNSMHKSSSGSVSLRYPSSWMGTMKARIESGRVDINGPDVNIEKDHKSWNGARIVKARRGNGNSRIMVRAVSGSVNIDLD
ncbi:MAG: hypothetical protein M1837_004322 [Sclerophora amabilis]|nr:MAG: hypothetical protein M1837_004322 [Sclerophora amabilis]